MSQFCESCGWRRVATHRVCFHDGIGPFGATTFDVCSDCAQEATSRGYGTATRLPHLTDATRRNAQ